jgi:carboxyl-terminal processing protease
MPKRNLYLLAAVALVSLVCYQKADSAHRSHYGKMFDTFVNVLEEVEDRYVEPVDERELFEGALEGMVHALDPNCAYLGPREAADSRAVLDQQFGGIGIEVSFDRETKVLTVITPVYGSPAFEQGVLPGDKIVKINDESTEGFTLADTVKRLRGKPGTSVRLSVLHPGQTEPVAVNITRAIIPVDSVLGDTRRADGSWNFLLAGSMDRIGYVRLTEFGKKTSLELSAALASLRAEGMQGLILDLRNNAGGLLPAAIEICDQFVSQGCIVTTRGREKTNIEVYEATGNAQATDFPIAVLVNQYSASASEILAACLQDHGRAIVVGQRSYGKGTVQSVIPLEGGRSEMRLTIATYWRPSGKNIHRSRTAKDSDEWGVSPDPGFEVKLTDAQLSDWVSARRKRDVLPTKEQNPADAAWLARHPRDDGQLEKAVEALEARIKERPASKESPTNPPVKP